MENEGLMDHGMKEDRRTRRTVRGRGRGREENIENDKNRERFKENHETWKNRIIKRENEDDKMVEERRLMVGQWMQGRKRGFPGIFEECSN